jgi:transcriptional regulator with XRE-family HTH domain
MRVRMRAAAEESGLTQEEIGVKMGFERQSARKAISRLLNAETYDPRLSTLVAFANAVGKSVKELV